MSSHASDVKLLVVVVVLVVVLNSLLAVSVVSLIQ